MNSARQWLIVAACAFGALVAAPSHAAEAQPVADDTALETRVEALSAQLRCLVCQNQSLADSHAALALDLKNQVREQLRAGRGEAQVIDYMTQRYGDFVLYKPPLKASTWLLWAGPALLALIGLAIGVRSVTRPAASTADDRPAPRALADAAPDWIAQDGSNTAVRPASEV
jgi:cytochrome c-type biogenesis protein CcmH